MTAHPMRVEASHALPYPNREGARGSAAGLAQVPFPPTWQPDSGLQDYDNARWQSGRPQFSQVRQAHGISLLWQTGSSDESAKLQVELCPNSHAVSFFRIGTSCALERKVGHHWARARYRARQGCLLMPDSNAILRFDQGSAGGWFHIHFDRKLLEEVQTAHALKGESLPLVTDPHAGELAMAFFDLASRQTEPEPIVWQSLGHVLLWRLLSHGLGKARQEASRGGLAPWQIKRATEYLEGNIERRVSLTELADCVRLSPYHFARAFSQSVGMPPYRFQQKLRLQRACDLLATTEMRVTEIALCSGYESPQALSRIFTREYGLSPFQWRRENRCS